MPTLPTELWWQILSISVHDSRLFETKWDHVPDDLMFLQGWERPYAIYGETLPTKLSICQVTRTWREIGVELLYEHLLFTRENVRGNKVIPKIATIFEQNAHRTGYGRSTKRVDVSIETLVEPYFSSFLRLLDCCHNIGIFVIAFPTVVGSHHPKELPSLFSFLQTRVGQSLRRLQIDLGHSVSQPFPHQLTLPNVPLETLELSTGEFLPDDSPPAIATVSTLTLDLSFNIREIPGWQFPALRHLCLNRIRNVHILAIQTFLVIHGPGLLSLNIEYLDTSIFFFLPGFLLAATGLHCLVLPTLPHPLPPDNNFPSITHIGLRNLRPYLSDLEAVASSPSFPGLQCIRYLNYTNPVENSKGPFDQAVPASSSTLGKLWNIRFEDQWGQLINLGYPQGSHRSKSLGQVWSKTV